MSADEVAESKNAGANEAVEAPTAEVPTAEPEPEPEPEPAEEDHGKEKKPKMAEEKKPRVPKKKQPKTPKPPHPPYFQMIKEAILGLDDKTGSSTYAIAKHMEQKHKGVLPPNYKKVLAVQLKNFTAKGKLVKVKASFKLSDAGEKDGKKKPTRKAAKEVGKKSSVATRAALRPFPSPSPSPKGKRTKKIADPTKPKQPKSIQPPAPARKINKASVCLMTTSV